MIVLRSLDSVEKSEYRSDKQCPRSRRSADSSEVQPQNHSDQNVNAALVETAVKIISEESSEAVSEDDHVTAQIEDIDEVLEKTRKAYATFIPENKAENNLKKSLNLANSLDHVAIESTDIDSVRKVI